MRRTRSDCTVGTFEKKHGLPPGTIRNKNGRDTRSDKKIGTIRKETREDVVSSPAAFFILLRTFQNPQNSWNQGRHNTKSREYRKALVIDKCLSSH